jgi:hypothetical protein
MSGPATPSLLTGGKVRFLVQPLLMYFPSVARLGDLRVRACVRACQLDGWSRQLPVA